MMKKSKVKDIEVRIGLSSDTPDLTCRDGEVVEFSGVDWLQGLADQAAAKENGSMSGSSASTPLTALRITGTPVGMTLPAGSTLLALHSPAALGGELRGLVLTSSGALALTLPAGTVTTLHSSLSFILGVFYRAIPYGDFILLIGEKGMKWVVFDPVSATYSLASEHPDAPQVTFRVAPETLNGYTPLNGGWPEIEVAVDIPDDLAADSAAFQSWLSGGVSSAVSEEVKARVYRAVGKGVAEYERHVAAKGLFLVPPRCVASYDGTLPSPMAVASVASSCEYSNPCARLKTWSYTGEILRLTVEFSLVPLRLSATYTVRGGQRIWARRFSNLEFGVTQGVKWHDFGNNLTATNFTSYIDPATQQRNGNAFRFRGVLSAEEVAERISRTEKFHIVKKITASSTTTGTLPLPGPDSFPDLSPAILKPDYNDLTLPSPRDGAATDQGFILFGRGVELRDSAGTTSGISLEKSVVASHPEYPFVFRYHCRAGEGRVLSVVQAGAARTGSSSGRHPVHILSSDGIRLLASDGNGGYLNSRLISRITPRRDMPVAVGHDRVFFLSEIGLCTLLASSSIEVLSPDAGGLRVEDDDDFFSDVIRMEVLGDNEALIIFRAGETTCPSLLDLTTMKESPQPANAVRGVCRHENRIIIQRGLDSAPSDLEVIGLERIALPDSVDHPSAGIAARILTRPLKLGSPFKRKRILGIGFSHPAMSLRLEGSDDLKEWRTLCQRNAIETDTIPSRTCFTRLPDVCLPACRFYRLQAACSPDKSSSLASFTFRVRE